MLSSISRRTVSSSSPANADTRARAACCAADAPEGPCRVLPDDRVGRPQRPDQRRYRGRVADVAQSDADVSLKADALRPLDRAAAEPLPELLVAQLQQRKKLRRREVVALPERRLAALGALAVHRAHVLADVAPEDPVAHQRPHLSGNRPPELDSQERDAAPVVDHEGRDDGAGRAVVDAPHAFAAILGERRVGLQLQVRDHVSQQDPGAKGRVQDVGVLAEPADSGALRRRAVVHGAVVDEDAGGNRPSAATGQALAELPEPGLHHVVIVVAPGVSRDPAVRPGAVGARVACQVAHRQRDDRPSAREQHLRPVGPSHAVFGVPRQAVHQPGPDPLHGRPLVPGERRGRRDARAVEAELARVPLDVPLQRTHWTANYGTAVRRRPPPKILRLIGPAGVTDRLRCHGGPPRRGWIPTFGDH